MRKLGLGLGLLVAAVMAISIWAYADVTVKKDSSSPAVGRFEIINVKTGGSGAVSSAGEIVTLDLTNLTGVNWQAVNALNVVGINWTGAQITTSGINWESVRMLSTPGNNASGVNWQAFGV